MTENNELLNDELENEVKPEPIKVEPEKEKTWIDKIADWGNAHPFGIAVIIVLCPIFLIWLGTRLTNAEIEEAQSEEIPADPTDGMKAIPVSTTEITTYKWVPEDEAE